MAQVHKTDHSSKLVATSWRPATVLILAVWCLNGSSFGCGSEVTEWTVCEFEGVNYETGDVIHSKDQCTTCVCQPGGDVFCFAYKCDEGCWYQGTHYYIHERFSETPGCINCPDNCMCTTDEQVECDGTPSCNGCMWEGYCHQVGGFKVTACKTCWCQPTGTVECMTWCDDD